MGMRTNARVEQIGNYVIEYEAKADAWGVRMAGAEEYISRHNTRSEAKSAVRRSAAQSVCGLVLQHWKMVACVGVRQRQRTLLCKRG